MKKIFFVIVVLLLLSNCRGLEFVYKINENIFRDYTLVSVEGDNAGDISGLLSSSLGNIGENEPKYKLLVSSLKTISAEVIEKDATASIFKTQFTINYSLYNISIKCKILDTKITTIGIFSGKSGGYSFGTDFSKKESFERGLNKNISEFISELNSIIDIDTCDN